MDRLRETSLINQNQPRIDFPTHVFEHQPHTYVSQSFQKHIDSLSNIHTLLHVWNHILAFLPTHLQMETIVLDVIEKKNGHRFSKWNNMDHVDQPTVLSILTQV